MAHSTPTHQITHTQTRTTAQVPLAERLHTRLASGEPLADPDKKYVAMAFKNTDPVAGPDMSREFVDFDALSIQRLPMQPDFDEEPVRMGPGGVVLDDSDYGEEE